MKLQTLRLIAALLVIATFSFCKNDAPASQSETTVTPGAPTETDGAVAATPTVQPAGDATAPNMPAIPTTAAAPTAEPAQNAEGVWHYTCPKGCAGGGGSAAPCAKCGTTLVHNSLYHGKASPAAAAPQTAGQTPGQTPAAKPEPAQNAAGVWHYTCATGCAGGAGSAVACATCGKTLAHNQAYHQ